MQVPHIRGIIKNDERCLMYGITDYLMNRISLENTTYFDFGRQTWIKNYLKDYYQFNSSGPALNVQNR